VFEQSSSSAFLMMFDLFEILKLKKEILYFELGNIKNQNKYSYRNNDHDFYFLDIHIRTKINIITMNRQVQ